MVVWIGGLDLDLNHPPVLVRVNGGPPPQPPNQRPKMYNLGKTPLEASLDRMPLNLGFVQYRKPRHADLLRPLSPGRVCFKRRSLFGFRNGGGQDGGQC